jgi:hypothetical protein
VAHAPRVRLAERSVAALARRAGRRAQLELLGRSPSGPVAIAYTAFHPNEEIAERLYLSGRTVERHTSNIYAKLHVSDKAARAAAAARFGRRRPHVSRGYGSAADQPVTLSPASGRSGEAVAPAANAIRAATGL